MPIHTLPLNTLEWPTFQKFCTDLLQLENGTIEAREYLKSGSKQDGIDIYVTRQGTDKLTVAQCKKKEYISPSEIDKIASIFLDGKYQSKTKEFILCTSFDFSAKETHENALDKIRTRLKENNIELRVWDLEGINAYLRANTSREHIAIVYRYFRHEDTLSFYGNAYNTYIQTLNLPEKKNYEFDLTNYIQRKIQFRVADNKSKLYTLNEYIKSELKGGTTPIQLLLTAPAGVGKSIELKCITHQLSLNNPEIYPLYIDLRDYNGEDIDDFMFASENRLRNVPNNLLFLIMDGLDEISLDLYPIAINKINLFLQRNSTNILISARSNFIDIYNSPIRNTKICILNHLTKADINQYIVKQLGEHHELFGKAVKKNGFEDYLSTPFYLINLLQLYKASNYTLPTSRGNLLKEILLKNLERDKLKYSTKDLIDKIFLLSQNIAFTTSLLGKTIISSEEIQILGHSKIQIIELERLSILQKDKSSISDDKWSFQHKNIQEYLTAEVMTKTSNIETILDILFVSEGSLARVNPRMLNTLSFLISHENLEEEIQNAILNKLFDNDPENLVNLEKDKIPATLRDNIFFIIWKNYKAQGLSLYTAGNFKLEDFAEFCVIDKAKTLFLLQEIESKLDSNSASDALMLIALSQKKYLVKKEIKNRLDKLLQNDLYPSSIKGTFLTTLYSCQVITEENFKDYVSSGLDLSNHNIRDALLGIIKWGKYSGYVAFILDSIEIFETNTQKINDSTVSYYIKDTLCHLESAYEIETVLKYLVNNPSRIDLYNVDEKVVFENSELQSILDNAAEIANNRITVLVYRLMRKLENVEFEGYVFQLFITFFKRLKIENIIFEKLYKWTNNIHISSPFLSINNMNYLNQLANGGEEDKKEVIVLLSVVYHHDELLFNRIKNEWKHINGFIFPELKKSKTHDELQRETNLKNQELLINHELFLKEIKDIFDIIGEDNHVDLMSLYKHQNLTPYYNSLALIEIRRGNRKNELNLEDIITKYTDEKIWQDFKIRTIVRMLKERYGKAPIDPKLIKYAKEWCMNILQTHDFRSMYIENGDGSFKVNIQKNNAIEIYRTLRFELNDELYLKLLHAENHLNHSSEKSLTKLILDNVSDRKTLVSTVISNIKERRLASVILMNHFEICKDLKIDESLELMYEHLKNSSSLNPLFKIRLADIYVYLSGEYSDLIEEEELTEKLMNNIGTDYDWFLFEKEIESDKQWVKKLLIKLAKEINRFERNDQTLIIQYLIQTGNKKGLDLWIEQSISLNKEILSERRNNFIEKNICQMSPIESINSLVYGLEKIYKNGLHKDYDHFESIYLSVTNLFQTVIENNSSAFAHLKKKLDELCSTFKDKSIFTDIQYHIKKCTEHYFRIKQRDYSIKEIRELLNTITTEA